MFISLAISFWVYTISLIHSEPNSKSVALKQICSIAAPIDNESPIIQLSSFGLNTNIKIYLEKEEKDGYVKVAGPEFFSSNVEDSDLGNSVMSLYKTQRKSNGNDNYRLRLWLSDTAVVTPNEIQNFGIKVALKGKAK